MNEFTKDELKAILYDLERNENPWQCGETIINKIQSMIHNYCDLEMTETEFNRTNHEGNLIMNAPLIIIVNVNYKGMHSALEIDLSEYNNEKHYLEVIKSHVHVAKIMIDKEVSTVRLSSMKDLQTLNMMNQK